MARRANPPTLYPNAEAVFRYLRTRADDSGKVAASRPQIATAIGVSEYTARTALKRLERLDAITIQNNSGPGGQTLTNIIHLKTGG